MKPNRLFVAALWLLVPFFAYADAPQGANAVLPQHAVVASANAQATDAGLEVLHAGGNAFDAAVAVSATLGLVEPESSGLGGGAFMLLHVAKDGRDVFVDAREKAPLAATRDMYLDAKGEVTRGSLDGAKAAGIPGTVAGLAMAREKFGTIPWAELVAPAIGLARDGHTLDSFHADDLRGGVERMLKIGDTRSAGYYRKADGSAYAAGETWKQPELAATLEKVAKDPRAFYEGPLADEMARRLKERYPDLIVCGTYCPPFRELSAEEDQQVVDMINETKPDIVWVGLGLVKQERWIQQHLHRVKAPWMVGVGAATDGTGGIRQK